MTDMDAIFMALAELAKQNREQAEEIAELKALTANANARLNAHFQLLEQMRRPMGVPSTRPVWRDVA